MDWNKVQYHFRKALIFLVLPMLGFTSSFGVYGFFHMFSPWYLAALSASSFEFVYIGLALRPHPTLADRRKARAISVAAVCVSTLYNVIDGLLVVDPVKAEAFAMATGMGVSVAIGFLAVAHGLPLAILTFFVSDLTLHSYHEMYDPTYLTEKKSSMDESLMQSFLEKVEQKIHESIAPLLPTDSSSLFDDLFIDAFFEKIEEKEKGKRESFIEKETPLIGISAGVSSSSLGKCNISITPLQSTIEISDEKTKNTKEESGFSIKDCFTNALLLKNSGLLTFQFRKEATTVWGCCPASTTSAVRLLLQEGYLSYNENETRFYLNVAKIEEQLLELKPETIESEELILQ